MDLGLPELELAIQAGQGRFRVLHRAFKGKAEPGPLKLDLRAHPCQGSRELVHDLGADVPVGGADLGLGHHAVGADQPEHEGSYGQARKPDLAVGDGNAGGHLVAVDPEGLLRIGNGQAEELGIEGYLNPGIGTVAHAVQPLHDLGVVHGRIPGCEDRPNVRAIHPEEQLRVQLMPYPVVEILRLELPGALHQVGVGDAQPGSHLSLCHGTQGMGLTRNVDLVDALKADLGHRDHGVPASLGKGGNLLAHLAKGRHRGSHRVVSLYKR